MLEYYNKNKRLLVKAETHNKEVPGSIPAGAVYYIKCKWIRNNNCQRWNNLKKNTNRVIITIPSDLTGIYWPVLKTLTNNVLFR